MNCERNKTEVVIINGDKLLPTNTTKHQNRSQLYNYVKKSKVLGDTIDEGLSFHQHAVDILRQCWHRALLVQDN